VGKVAVLAVVRSLGVGSLASGRGAPEGEKFRIDGERR
jgi:hypothetical protein